MENRSYAVCKVCSALNPPSARVCFQCDALFTHNLRKYERLNVEIAGTANLPSGGQCAIDIRNISMGGLMFRSDRPFLIEDVLRLKLPLDGDCFTVEAEVRHCSEDYEGYSVGVEFAATSPPFVFKLHSMLKSTGEV